MGNWLWFNCRNPACGHFRAMALAQLWLFWVAPLIGAALGGVVYRWVVGDSAGAASGDGRRDDQNGVTPHRGALFVGHAQETLASGVGGQAGGCPRGRGGSQAFLDRVA